MPWRGSLQVRWVNSLKGGSLAGGGGPHHLPLGDTHEATPQASPIDPIMPACGVAGAGEGHGGGDLREGVFKYCPYLVSRLAGECLEKTSTLTITCP